MSKANIQIIPEERIADKIYLIRGQRVILDRDLAKLYHVSTGVLNQAVKRNESRFPDDFKFQLTDEENDLLRDQNGVRKRGGRRYNPLVFTELGVVMLSAVLKSEQAVSASILVARTFVRLRQFLATNDELRGKILEIEQNQNDQSEAIEQIVQIISELVNPPIGKERKLGF